MNIGRKVIQSCL